MPTKQKVDTEHQGGTIVFIEETITALNYADKAIEEKGFSSVSEHIDMCKNVSSLIKSLNKRTPETFAGVIIDTTRLAREKISPDDYKTLVGILKTIPHEKIKIIYKTDKNQAKDDQKTEEVLFKKMHVFLEP